MSKSRTVVTAVSTALAGLLLTGCAGSASPGVAVAVGEETISVDRVDSATDHMCSALADEFSANGQSVPMGFVRQGVVQLLAIAEMARQVADHYDVEPGAVYQRDRAQREQLAESLPAEVRADYVDVMSASALANAVLEKAGREALERDGVENPTTEQITQRGADIFASWPDAHGIEVDPRYGLRLVDGNLVPADTNLSVAVSDAAKQGLATEPDAVYASTLPAGHRCG